MGPGGLEPPTSPLSGVRSSQLSYEPRTPGRTGRISVPARPHAATSPNLPDDLYFRLPPWHHLLRRRRRKGRIRGPRRYHPLEWGDHLGDRRRPVRWWFSVAFNRSATAVAAAGSSRWNDARGRVHFRHSGRSRPRMDSIIRMSGSTTSSNLARVSSFMGSTEIASRSRRSRGL